MSDPAFVYAETMDKLSDSRSWDVPGLIADVAERLKESGDGEAMAVIDHLLFRIRDIAGLISPLHARVISPKTITEAAHIASAFCRSPLNSANRHL